MKKIAFLYFCLLSVFSGIAQKQYEIYRVEGEALVQRQGSDKWQKAELKMKLAEGDVVNVKGNGTISFLDGKCGRIYQSSTTGKSTVKMRVEKSEKETSKMFKNLNKELVKAANKDAKSNNGYVSYAASSRGIPPEADIYDSVYALLRQGVFPSESVVDVKKQTDGNGFCSYIVTNNSDETLYFNAVAVNGERTQVLYDFNQETIGMLPIDANMTVDLSAYKFMDENKGSIFVFSRRKFCLPQLEKRADRTISLGGIKEVSGVKCVMVK